jgi:hypothetical protein
MKTIQTILCEDFGRLDRDLVRTQLLGQRGICDVHCASARNGLVVEYDPDVLDHRRLLDIMCHVGVFPDSRGVDFGRRSVTVDDDTQAQAKGIPLKAA